MGIDYAIEFDVCIPANIAKAIELPPNEFGGFLLHRP